MSGLFGCRVFVCETCFSSTGAVVGLCTILLLPILYGVRHTQGGSGKRVILRNRRAIVLQ